MSYVPAALVGRSAEWFWSKVDQTGGLFACWLWTGARLASGYGEIWHRGTHATRGRSYAHRTALELALGRPLRTGMFACHTCDNTQCVNPAHLYEGTHAENTRDSVDRGRVAYGERSAGARLHETAVIAIREALEQGGRSHRLIGQDFGVSRQTIDHIARGSTWKRVGSAA